jgi:hypothetical protein
MTTYVYLKKGLQSKQPYHLIAADNTRSMCGRVERGGEGVTAVVCAPTPMGDGLVCEKCRQAQALETIKRVAAASPFAEVIV